jgi:benzoate membrane transport protein
MLGRRSSNTVAYVFLAWLLAVTAPLLVLLDAGRRGTLGNDGWMVLGYALGGVVTLVLALWSRLPMAGAWTISGAVIVAGFLVKDLAGAGLVYILAAVLSLVLGAAGALRFVLDRVPEMPAAERRHLSASSHTQDGRF